MGATVAPTTIQSKVVENDDDAELSDLIADAGVASVAFASMGTSPALTSQRGGRIRVTSGSGTPAIAANNIQVTLRRAPRAVYLRNSESAPGFHVASVSGSVVNIGTKVAPAASTAYDLELLVRY